MTTFLHCTPCSRFNPRINYSLLRVAQWTFMTQLYTQRLAIFLGLIFLGHSKSLYMPALAKKWLVMEWIASNQVLVKCLIFLTTKAMQIHFFILYFCHYRSFHSELGRCSKEQLLNFVLNRYKINVCLARSSVIVMRNRMLHKFNRNLWWTT